MRRFLSIIARLFHSILSFNVLHGDAGETTLELPRSGELRDRAVAAGAKLAALRNKPEADRGDTHATDLRNAAAEVYDLNGLLDTAQRVEAYDLQALAFEHALQRAANGPEPTGPQAAFEHLTRGASSPFEDLVTSEAYTEWATRSRNGGSDAMPALELQRSLLGVETRNTLSGADTDASLLLPQGSPAVPVARQMRFWLRDVLSVQGTGLAAIPYVREENPATNETGATGVAEGGLKPEVTMEFVDDTAVVKKIAAWIPATMEILADAPTLLGYINTRLVYMLKVREQAQIIDGAGSGAQLKGILQFSGVQTQSAVAGDIPQTFAQAIAKVENVDLEANGIAMNPLDYWAGVSTRFSTSLDADAAGSAPYGTPAPTLWGLPVIRTRALASSGGAATGKAIVGDWAMGATLFDRMQATIRQSDSHDTFFIYNKVAILAEERIALAVHRPDAFVDVTVDTVA